MAQDTLAALRTMHLLLCFYLGLDLEIAVELTHTNEQGIEYTESEDKYGKYHKGCHV